jgi:hypothetical protein
MAASTCDKTAHITVRDFARFSGAASQPDHQP